MFMSRLSPCRLSPTLRGSLLISVTWLAAGPLVAFAQQQQQQGAGTATAPSAAPSKRLWESWDAVYMGQTKIGSIHTVLDQVDQQGRQLVRGNSVSKMEILRFGQKAVMESTMTSLETSQGEVLSFQVETRAGPSPVIVKGVSRDDVMQLTTTSQGKQTTSQLPWQKSYGGFFALDQALMQRPMKPGEKRELTTLMPGVAGVQLVKSHLQAQQMESVELLDGQQQQLLRVAMTNLIGSQQLDSVCWTNAQGDVLKSSVPALLQTIYRTSQQRAQTTEQGSYDLGLDSVVKVSPALPHPRSLIRLVVRASLAQRDPARVFTSGHSQRVERISDHQARITVVAVRPGSPLSGADDAPPTEEHLASSNLIQADAPEVIAMAQRLSSTATSTWAQCIALERGVCGAIRNKNFGHGFATAADVAKTLEGDCTEHAVLLAALCRAEKIPSRVALGLVYTEPYQGFAFHMWTEAWVGDRWIPLDATLGRGGIDAAYLKLTHSTLARDSAESAVLSVIQVINQLSLTVEEMDPHAPPAATTDR